MHILEEQNAYIESKYYRCLEYRQGLSEDLYLILCGIEQCLPGKIVGPQIRDGYHLHIVFKGKGIITCDGKETQVHSGQLFIVKQGEMTRYTADMKDPWHYAWITFCGNKAKDYVLEMGFGEGVNVLDSHLETSRFVDLIKQMLDKPQLNLSSDLYRMGIVYQVLSLAVESHYKTQQRSDNYHHFSPDDYVEYTLNYINRNYATVKVNDLADNIGITREYLATIFKNKMGISPREYIMDMKLTKSCELLDQSLLSISEIASRVGYDNVLTFSKIFKQKYKISPKYYRENGLKEEKTNEY